MGMTLVQGAGGTGKTYTICAMISHIAETRPGAKILVCAVSNAAVDTVLEMYHSGHVRTAPVNIVRLGRRSDMRPSVRRHSLQQILEDRGHDVIRPLPEAKKAILDAATVVAATLHDSADVSKDYPWDTIIIDDAGQATIPQTLIPLVGVPDSTMIVLVGDLAGMPAVIDHPVARQYGLSLSMFARIVNNGWPVQRLNPQYRMVPALAALSSRLFYNNAVQNAPEVLARPVPPWYADDMLGPCTWIHVGGPGGESVDVPAANSSSRFRNAEIKPVIALLKRIPHTLSGSPPDIGVMTPYAAQRDELQKALDSAAIGRQQRVEVDTIDGFQGREKDIIIMSMVHCGRNIGFMAEPGRINVSITRARSSLWFVGDLPTWSHAQYWRDIVQACKVFDFDVASGTFSPRA